MQAILFFYGGSYDARIQNAKPNDSVLNCIGKFLLIVRKIKNSEYESMDAFEADEDAFQTNYLPVAGNFVTLDYFSDLLNAYRVFGKLHFEETDMASMIPDYSDDFLYLYVSPNGKNAIDCMLKVKSIERKHGKKVVLILDSDPLRYKSMFSDARVFQKVISSKVIDQDIVALASFSSASIISHKNGRVSIRQLILSDY